MKIATIGCGWLGRPLAQKLIVNGHQVVATCRSEESVTNLRNIDIDAMQFNLGESLAQQRLTPLHNANVLVLNIPPGRKNTDFQQFTENMCTVISEAKQVGIAKLIFISSTSVYGNQTREIFEYSEPSPDTQSAAAHLKIENHCRQIYTDNASILRLSGLVGENRHPINSLAGKHDIPKGKQRINLIHQQDVISAIEQIIGLDYFGFTLHLSCSEHPSRQKYYQWAATEKRLQAPQFHDDGEAGKSVNCEGTLQSLKFNLQYPSPYDF